jgi:hypothetical protein
MEAVEDMAVPDTFALARPNEATLNSGGYQELCIGADFSFALWKVAAD